jgi:hypothetical protein
MCAWMNSLRVKDFAKVPPGGTFDPYQRIDDEGFFDSPQICAPETFREAGVYRLRFVYSTNSADMKVWAGEAGDGGREVLASEQLANLFKQVPKLEIRSNEFELTVTTPGK